MALSIGAEAELALIEIAPGIFHLRIGPEQARWVSQIYLVRGERDALVECGPASIAKSLLAMLREGGVDQRGIAYLLPTHIHLDHAGGAGVLARALPWAQVVAHPSGAGHLINPARLIQSTRQVFGADFERRYGEIAPIPPEQVVAIADGARIELGNRPLRVLYTPGHAPHHLSFMDEKTGSLFCGEGLGHYLQNLDLLVPSVALPLFELEMALDSIDRMEREHPSRLIFSQYGMSVEVSRMFAEAREVTRAVAELVLDSLRHHLGEREMERRLHRYLVARAEESSRARGQTVRLDGLWADYHYQTVAAIAAYYRKQGMG